MNKSWQSMYEDAIRARRDDKARIAALEARLTKIYGKASSCDPSHYNNTMTEIINLCCSAETDCDHDLQHATHTMVVASYPDYQTATCRVCGAQFSTDVRDSTEKWGGEHG